MVLCAENTVGSAGNPAVSLTFACESLLRSRVAGACIQSGDVMDTDGEDGAEAGWERGQW